jgi:cell wall-associated NlpC family hydrolase
VLALLAAAGCGTAAHDDASVKAGGQATGAHTATSAVHVTTTARTHRSTSPAQERLEHHDTEADSGFVQSRRTVHGPSAPTPDTLKPAATATPAPSDGPSPTAPSDAEIRRELKAMHQVMAAQRQRVRASTGGEVEGNGSARAPAGAPAAVARIVAAGNAIARFPYIYGGGHGSFVDTGYDCSGSVSYALAGAGLLHRPLTSGALAGWGDPGPGRWVTIYANAGHVFMTVAGLRFDTSGRAGPRGSRWQTAPRSTAGFTVRHPPGL